LFFLHRKNESQVKSVFKTEDALFLAEGKSMSRKVFSSFICRVVDFFLAVYFGACLLGISIFGFDIFLKTLSAFF